MNTRDTIFREFAAQVWVDKFLWNIMRWKLLRFSDTSTDDYGKEVDGVKSFMPTTNLLESLKTLALEFFSHDPLLTSL